MEATSLPLSPPQAAKASVRATTDAVLKMRSWVMRSPFFMRRVFQNPEQQFEGFDPRIG
jgi:hypothetical protein